MDCQMNQIKVEGEANPSILFSISNSGVLLAPEEQERLFEQFYQSGKTALSNSGLGLGLSICKEIVENHHGRIWSESTESGIKFLFELPVQSQEL